MAQTVAIIGCGLVGRAWAMVFARAGYAVRLFDSDAAVLAAAPGHIAQGLTDLAAAGLAERPQEAIARVHVAGSLAEALDGAIYAQESVLERVEIKRDLFAAIDAVIGPDTLVGSSSSGIPASAFTDHCACRDRCLITHPVNPPHVLKVVELVPAPWTSEDTVRRVRALMSEVGQAPVELTREIEGFILNRLQAVLLMEAWRLVEEGYVTTEDLDLTLSEGLGMRWSFMGPFETIDLNAVGGVADYARRLGPLYQSIAASRADHRVWDAPLIERIEAQRREALQADQLAQRSLWRDRRLMALARHKQQAAADDEAAS